MIPKTLKEIDFLNPLTVKRKDLREAMVTHIHKLEKDNEFLRYEINRNNPPKELRDKSLEQMRINFGIKKWIMDTFNITQEDLK